MYDADGRLVRTVEAPEWTDEDRRLLLAYQRYLDEHCPGCGHPKATAWHPDNDGFFEADHQVICHACTAIKAASTPDAAGEKHKEVEPVVYLSVTDTRDYARRPLPALDLHQGGAA